MWIVANREYNEDPVFLSLVSPAQFAARRRTILVFTDRGPAKGVERLALGGGSNGGLYTVYRDPDVETRELWGARTVGAPAEGRGREEAHVDRAQHLAYPRVLGRSLRG